MSVITVQGEIDPEKLGMVLPHEHILIDLRNQFSEPPEVTKKQLSGQQVNIDNMGVLRRNPWALIDNLVINDMSIAEEEVLEYKRAGGDTIVDVTNIGLGRDPVALRRISRATGVNIIAGCSYYYHDTHPKDMGSKTVEDIKNQIICDIETGMDETGIRAGVIGEIGVSQDMHVDERKVLAASGRAQAETGAGVQVHIFPWGKGGGKPLGMEALSILVKHGADPEKVSINHVDVAMDIRLDYCIEILETGAYVEFDNFGHEFYVDKANRKFIPGPFALDFQRVDAIKKLIDRGYLSKILVSTDICHKTLLHHYGGWGYDHIPTNIVPMMKDKGITGEQINTLLRVNPVNFLDIKRKAM